jgi:hypothetical protein
MLPIEEAIIIRLRSGPCCFDEIVTGLPDFSWREIFTAVDCMSRDGRVFLRKLGFSTYEISLGLAAYRIQSNHAFEGEAINSGN